MSILKQLGGVCLAVLIGVSGATQAGPGHNHGPEEATAVANPGAPQRNPDGSVFLPKPGQRFITLRTQRMTTQSLPHSVVLYGNIVPGNDAISRVRALQAGRLALEGGTLPAVGDRIVAGQRLATIEIARDAQEGTNQAAEVADLREQLKLARLEDRRLRKLGDAIPKREVDAAQAEVRGLQARIRVLSQGGGGGTERVVAPINGIVTSSYASDDQAVQAGDLLLEIIDPGRLQLEAVTYDPSLPANIAGARIKIGARHLDLDYLGRSPQLRQQALPLRFGFKFTDGEAASRSAQAEQLGLVAGLPVQVTVQTKQRLQGFAIPADALVRDPSNQSVVWVKQAPEQFISRRVRYQPLDGARLMVTDGLEEGDRVVIRAANLLNQIR